MLKKAIFFTLLISIIGCETRTFTTYTVRNESDYDIQIRAYYGGNKYDEINILSKGEYVKKAIYAGPGADITLFDGNVIGKSEEIRDSAVVVFDNKKVLVQWCRRLVDLGVCGGSLGGNVIIPKNLGYIIADSNNVRPGDSYRKGFKRRQGPFIITFDNSDYERAVAL
jgi:hypothetical protein